MLSDVAAIYTENSALFAGSVFVLGLVVGSFLNVVIYRLPIILDREWRVQASEFLPAPEGEDAVTTDLRGTVAGNHRCRTDHSIVTTPRTLHPKHPRSACPTCKAPIKAWQNIPLVSWLALRGRCASCKTRISARYPLVELATGILSAWVAWHFGFGIPAVCALGVTWALIALTGIDIDHQLLPDNITLPLLWAGLLASVIFGVTAETVGAGGGGLAATVITFTLGTAGIPTRLPARRPSSAPAAGYLSLWLVFHAFRLITGKEGMGYGDFKLFAALGAWLGWKLLPLIILLSAATGAVLGILMIVLRGRDRAAPMPFGPYLAAAGWLAMLYGDSLVNGYLRLSGLRH